jgi:hypothetical protein
VTLYDELRKHHSAPAEQKLKILREELLRPILTVETSAELLREIMPEISGCLPADISPEELQNTIKWLAEAGSDLQQILDALTLDSSDVPAPRTGD